MELKERRVRQWWNRRAKGRVEEGKGRARSYREKGSGPNHSYSLGGQLNIWKELFSLQRTPPPQIITHSQEEMIRTSEFKKSLHIQRPI